MSEELVPAGGPPPPSEEPPQQGAAGAAKGEAGEAASESAGAEERIAELEQEVASLKDQLLRRAADYENFRKRMAREREDSITYANQMLLLDLVQIIDDFERAIGSAESSKDFGALHDGVLLIERQFSGMLEKKWNLVRFESKGQPFDPNRHHAVATEDGADVEVPTVVEEYQTGYLFRDRVLRPAAVKVAQPAPVETSEQRQDNLKDKET